MTKRTVFIVEYVVCYGSATGDGLGYLLLINIITVVGRGYTWNFKGGILIFMAEVWTLYTCFLLVCNSRVLDGSLSKDLRNITVYGDGSQVTQI
jgi:hypothetical protein